VRHGEANYSDCTNRGLIGQGRDLSALNTLGMSQMHEVAQKLQMLDIKAEVILSSPYTRALHSSAIIAQHLALETNVVHDLHEWIPDMTFQYKSYLELKQRQSDFKKNKGVHPYFDHVSGLSTWEPLADLKKRVKWALIPYCNLYDEVIVVTHGMVIQCFHYEDQIDNGQIVTLKFDKDFLQPIWPIED